ncbi:unnamed protein product [Malus baccata var. baccata]
METTLEIHWSYWCDPLELLVRPLGCTPSVRRKVRLLPYALHTASLLFSHVYMLPSLQSSVQETYTRRMTTCLAAGFVLPNGIVINMVVGGEVVTLKSLEESSNLVIAEMPIHVSLLMRMFPTFLVSYLVSQQLSWLKAT